MTEAREPAFYWSGLPVYRCRYCGDRFERVDNLKAVLDHEAALHPVRVRTSPILGPEGQAVEVIEDAVAGDGGREGPDAGDLIHVPGLPAGTGLRVQLEEESHE